MTTLALSPSPLPSTHPLVSLLGDTLIKNTSTNKDQKPNLTEVKTADVLGGKSAICLYFSAHWCPPCRQFTPMLSKNYSNHLKDKNLEVVFVSSDRDKSSFEDYYGGNNSKETESMPWLALPYEKREVKEKLSKMCKVQGIPSVVVLDAVSGKISNLKGRDCVMGDEKGEKLPWKAVTLKEALDTTFKSKSNQSLPFYETFAGKKVALYFSASWCPPCQNFTPKLIDVYNKVKKSDSDESFEILFISSDRDQSSFDDYYKKMPWGCMEYSDRTGKQNLSSVLDVSGIPCLIMLEVGLPKTVSDSSGDASTAASNSNIKTSDSSDDSQSVTNKPTKATKDNCTVTILNSDCAGKVRSDPEGLKFPWIPDLVKEVNADGDGIDEQPSIVVLFEGVGSEGSDEKKKAEEQVVKNLTPIAKKYKLNSNVSEDKDSDNSSPEFQFFYGSEEGPLTSKIRSFCGQEEFNDDSKKKESDFNHFTVLILDIDDNMSYYCTEKLMKLKEAPTGDQIEYEIKQFKEGKLEKKKMVM